MSDYLHLIRKALKRVAGSDDDQYMQVGLMGTKDNGFVESLSSTPEGHLEVAIHSPRLPFGEVEVAELEPVFQSDAVYGVNSSEVIVTTDGASGTATASNNLFSVGTGGTTAGYFGTIQSRKRLRYRPGQGVVSRFTMLFTSGVENNVQVVGVGTGESTFAFGYNGTSFGILHSTGGVREIQTLTLTVGAGGSENVTVKLNGVDTVVAVVAGNTTSTAYQLSIATYSGWTAVQRGATVVFLSNSVGNKTNTFSVTSTGTAAGSFAETLAGVSASDNWIPQASWNGDVCDGTGSTSNPSGVLLDPTKGNVGQIGIQYLGFGAVNFQIEMAANGNNPDFVNVHTIRFPNSQTTTNVSQPSFPFLMSAYNTGTATGAVTTKCGSFAGFIAGIKKLSGPRMSYFNTVTSSTSAFVPLFTIRNDRVYAGRANQSVINLLSIGGSTKSTNGVTAFYVIRNATLSTGTPNFTQFATTSCSYWDTATTAVTYSTNDQVLWTGSTTGDGQINFSFTDEITLQPGETITLAVKSVTGTATCLGQINTREDQ